MIKIYFLYALLFLNNLIVSGQFIRRLDQTTLSYTEADTKINKMMREGRVTGLGIAVFNKNKIVYKRAFGLK